VKFLAWHDETKFSTDCKAGNGMPMFDNAGAWEKYFGQGGEALASIGYSLPVLEREIKKLELHNGLVPFDEWFDSLRDQRMQVAVDARLTRVRAGNFGDCKSVGGGVFELRIALGPGLRVYYGLHGRQIVVLLGGGDKSSQARDIRRAQQLWQQFTKHAS